MAQDPNNPAPPPSTDHFPSTDPSMDPDPTTTVTTPIPPIDNIHSIPDPVPLPFPTIHDAETAPAPPTPAPQPPRTSTPTRHMNGTSVSIGEPMPSKAASHGAPARRYLNERVTGTLLEGMKRVAAEQPENPLVVLGEFLVQKGREREREGEGMMKVEGGG